MNKTGKRTLFIALCVLLTLSLIACHRHTPGEVATCTQPQLCKQCGEELAAARGHTPGEEATCTAAQTCTVCGEELAAAKGHVPGEEATCTAAQTCTVCGEELAAARGHIPGEEATCTTAQTCTACGEELAAAKGHDVGDDGVCKRCGKQIKSAGGPYVPGSSGQHDEADAIPETAAGDHYHNNIDAHYSKNVLVCGDYAMEYFNLGTAGSSTYAQIVNRFASKYPQLNVTSVLVPKCCAFYSPAGYDDPGPDIREYIANTYAMMDDRVKKADAFGVMSQHEGEYMFYRTDHHWTGLGAYYAYVAYCNANGLTAAPLSSYSTVINTGFIGTLYYYAGNPAVLKTNPDYTAIHLPQTGHRMRNMRGGAWYDGKAVYTDANSYAGAYLGGDHPLSVIETDNKNGKAVAVFKESYGNAFVPYLIDQYQYVIVLDIRESDGTFSQLVADYPVTDVVIINNLQGAVSLQGALEKRLNG